MKHKACGPSEILITTVPPMDDVFPTKGRACWVTIDGNVNFKVGPVSAVYVGKHRIK